MNDLTTDFSQSTLTMSSREIATITGKEHRNVMRDIRYMLVELHGEEGVLSFEQTYTDQQNGQTYPCFQLPKRESLILVSGYNVSMRAKIIDRWQELETQAKQPSVPAVRDPRTAALIESLVRFDALEQEQLRLRDEQDELRRQTQEVATRLNQIETAQNHFTIVGYATATGHNSVALRHAASLGRSATRYCKDNNIEMGEVPDPRFGRVKTYPQWVLDIIFAEDVSVT